MPHCIIEYSDDLDNKQDIIKTVKAINTAIENSELFDNKTIKTRALPIHTYLVGGIKKPFVHITVKILEGRTDSQKQQLSNRTLQCITAKYDIEDISVEIVELDISHAKK